MTIWIAIAARAPEDAKSRLASVLPASQRAELCCTWFRHVLKCALDVVRPCHIVIVSRSAMLCEEAQRAGAHGLLDTGSGLNAALTQAATFATAQGASHLLTLHADLPMLTADDLLAMIEAVQAADIVIAPDRHDEGTNALLRALPLSGGYHHGEGSFARHRKMAADAGLSSAIIRREGLGFDVDTPADLARLQAWCG